MTLKPITPEALAADLSAGGVTLIDIRDPDEFAREHIAGAVSMPVASIAASGLALEPRGKVVFHCKSGMRTATHCATLAAHVDGEAYMLTGGIEAWKQQGRRVITDKAAPLELNRQVQITIGVLVLVGAALAAFAHPGFILAPAFFGAGLLFAGLSGWCGMAKVLAAAPWNRRAV